MHDQERQIPAGQQLREHPGFVAPDEPYDCRACIHFHGQRNGFPDLLEANTDALAFYGRIQGQQRAGGLDLIGLDITALPVVFDLYEIDAADRRLLFEQLMVIDAVHATRRQRRREYQQAKAEAERSLGGGSRKGR